MRNFIQNQKMARTYKTKRVDVYVNNRRQPKPITGEFEYSEAVPYTVESDGTTVWVNGVKGLVGRFGVFGIDIHRPPVGDGSGECLFCTHERTTAVDWELFVMKMKALYNVVVEEVHKPTRFR